MDETIQEQLDGLQKPSLTSNCIGKCKGNVKKSLAAEFQNTVFVECQQRYHGEVLKEYVLAGASYVVRAAIIHIGHDVFSGHYYLALRHRSDDLWYTLDDAFSGGCHLRGTVLRLQAGEHVSWLLLEKTQDMMEKEKNKM